MIWGFRNLDRAQLRGGGAPGGVSLCRSFSWSRLESKEASKIPGPQRLHMASLSRCCLLTHWSTHPSLQLHDCFPKRPDFRRRKASTQIYACFTVQSPRPSPRTERMVQGHEHQNAWLLGGRWCNSPPARDKTPGPTLALELSPSSTAFPNGSDQHHSCKE